MQEELDGLPQRAKDKHKENKKFFSKLKKKPPRDLDVQMHEMHEEEFQRTDCLSCANCCKTTGPLFTNKDIERIARHQKMKPRDFIDRYLYMDEDRDYVLQELPCPFLAPDNYCLIYEVRPKACSEFPHTNRKDFQKISYLTMKNVAICPAAYNIVEEMKRRMKG